MRTIKFRGLEANPYCEELRTFLYGTPLFITNEENYILPNFWDYEGLNKFKVLKKTISQFTGLHDKNGKEIYTGDILQLKKLDGSVLLYKIFSVKGGFAFNTHQDDFHKPQSEIYFYESTSDMQNSAFISTLQIIGNSFENPELLEKKFAD